MELVKIHLLEAPSGIEIIKRLLKKNLIEEFDDPKDKRAKRLKITEKGVNEIKSLEPKMNELYKDLVEKLNINKKVSMLSLIKEVTVI